MEFRFKDIETSLHIPNFKSLYLICYDVRYAPIGNIDVLLIGIEKFYLFICSISRCFDYQRFDCSYSKINVNVLYRLQRVVYASVNGWESQYIIGIRLYYKPTLTTNSDISKLTSLTSLCDLTNMHL